MTDPYVAPERRDVVVASAARYARAFNALSAALRADWTAITKRGLFDLNRVFPGDSTSFALDVHLHCVGLLAGRLHAEQIAVDFAPFSTALRARTAHPDVTLLVADATAQRAQFRLYDSTVSVLRAGDEVHSAVWTHLAHPVSIKICYMKAGAPVNAPPDGHPWHPQRQRKIVKLSPYKADVQPSVKRRDLRI